LREPMEPGHSDGQYANTQLSWLRANHAHDSG
jgi:hypothetical protein